MTLMRGVVASIVVVTGALPATASWGAHATSTVPTRVPHIRVPGPTGGPWAPWRPAIEAGRWRPGLPGQAWFTGRSPLSTPNRSVAGGWQIQPTPNPAVRNGALQAVSCSGPAACTAVGGYQSRSGRMLPLAERWNGRRWRVQATPAPAAAIWSQLFGVSCTSSRTCVAVGYYFNRAARVLTLVERWDGRKWRIQAARNPSGDVATGFFAVACTSARSCFAVGARTSALGKTTTLAERWDGTRWRVTSAPNPARSRGSALLGVSCSGPRACTAAGSYASAAGKSLPLAERWNGRSWRIQATPTPTSSAGSAFFSVSCGSAGSCVAVGSYLTARGRGVLLAERWNGARWRIQPAPVPEHTAQSEFLGVSCTSVRFCTAVGAKLSQARVVLPFVERWTGTRWVIQHTRAPGRSVGGAYVAVSCLSSHACTAAGSVNTFGGSVTLAAARRGGPWHLQRTPNPVGTEGGVLAGVSCSSKSACTAVGGYTNGGGRGVAFAERWNGTAWHIEGTPPAGHNAELISVSCPAPAACIAVGSTFVVGKEVPLAEVWNGTRWLETAPLDVTAGTLTSVSCASATDCTAVGRRAGHDAMLAERWDGENWKVQTTPHPPGAGQLNGVSCASASSCVAVGGDFAEIWNGASWSFQNTATITGNQGIELSGVSCTSKTACTAVGSYFTATRGPITLAEVWNGTSWQKQPTPNRHGAQRNDLASVSCGSASTCTAVGNYAASDFAPPHGLIEHWNGTGWTIQAAPIPVGATLSELVDVTCPSATACTAVGLYALLNSPVLPFAIATR
jgi:hypothetical protein